MLTRDAEFARRKLASMPAVLAKYEDRRRSYPPSFDWNTQRDKKERWEEGISSTLVKKGGIHVFSLRRSILSAVHETNPALWTKMPCCGREKREEGKLAGRA